jgi:phytoene synthase
MNRSAAVADDYGACAEVLRRSGSTFALPIRLLPAAKRRATTALYAFCRLADDVVDDAADAATARRDLDALEGRTEAALAGGPATDPVLRALADTVRRYAVPASCIRDILDGVRMDLDQVEYETFAELAEYCRRVAGAVGVAAIHIWGFTSSSAIAAAHDCGLAFQLTNILRDIPEDLGRGRIYLPREDLAVCDCSADDLRRGRIGPGFSRLAALERKRASGLYARAARLDGMLSTDGRIVFRAMLGGYRSLFRAVERAGNAIFTRRVRPSRPRMLAAVATTVLLGPTVPRWWR